MLHTETVLAGTLDLLREAQSFGSVDRGYKMWYVQF